MNDISITEKAALDACLRIARTSSDDAETRTACVLMTSHCTLYSSNRIPSGIHWRTERTRRPVKYTWIEHAERLAVLHAARFGIATDGATAILPWYPCVECGQVMMLAGIKRVVSSRPDFEDPRWGADFIKVDRMLAGSSIETVCCDVRPDTNGASILPLAMDGHSCRRQEAIPITIAHKLASIYPAGGILLDDGFLPVPEGTPNIEVHPAYRLFGHAAKTGRACEGGHFIWTDVIDVLAARAIVSIGCSSAFAAGISPDARVMLSEAQIPFTAMTPTESSISTA